jgi:hypothetical protein
LLEGIQDIFEGTLEFIVEPLKLLIGHNYTLFSTVLECLVVQQPFDVLLKLDLLVFEITDYLVFI